MVYEYLITLDQEIAIVWRRKFALTSVLVLALRWSMVATAILNWVPISTDLVRGVVPRARVVAHLELSD